MGILGKFLGAAARSPARCSAVIAAAGSSRRMGGQDKLFAPLGGETVLLRTLRIFENAPCVEEIILVIRQAELERVTALCAEAGLKKVATILAGGETRLHSVFAGVMATSPKAKLVAVHDGARPLVSCELIQRTVDSARENSAALPMLQARETVKTLSGGLVDKTLDRSGIYLAQTPQVFDADLLKAALQNALDKGLPVTDDAQAAEAIGLKPAFVEGEARNIKITTPEDLLIAEALLGDMETCE